MVDEVLINKTTVGDQDWPSVAGFRGTQFVVAWADRGSGDIKGRLLGLNGVATTDEFLVNFPGKVGTKRDRPAVLETNEGFAIAWIETAPGGQAQIRFRIFDADTLSGPESDVSSSPVEPFIRPVMARLSGGGLVIVWVDKRADQRIRAQRFDSDGTKSGAEFRANTVPGLHRVPMVAALTNGNIVIGWRARLAGPLLVHLQIFNATGPVGGELTTTLNITEAAMTALDSGRFVIAHIRSALDGEEGFDTTIPQLSVFEANGTLSNMRFPATSGTNIQSSWPSLAALSGGRFLFAWTQVNTANAAAGTNVHARLFSSQGPVGQVTQVNTLKGGPRFTLTAAVTSGPSGDIAFPVWVDESGAGADKSERGIEGRPITIPAAGF